MKKNKLLLVLVIIVSMAALTGCNQGDYKVKVFRGISKNTLDIYYDENYTMEDYEWSGTDLTIHFKEEK